MDESHAFPPVSGVRQVGVVSKSRKCLDGHTPFGHDAAMAQPDLLTSTEVGRILGCSGRTVQRRADAGVIPIERQLPGPNGAYLFRRSDIEALAAEMAS